MDKKFIEILESYGLEIITDTNNPRFEEDLKFDSKRIISEIIKDDTHKDMKLFTNENNFANTQLFNMLKGKLFMGVYACMSPTKNNDIVDKAKEYLIIIDKQLSIVRKNIAELNHNIAVSMAEEINIKLQVQYYTDKIINYATSLQNEAGLTRNKRNDTVFAEKRKSENTKVELQHRYLLIRENINRMQQTCEKLEKEFESLNIDKQRIKAQVDIAEKMAFTPDILEKKDKQLIDKSDFSYSVSAKGGVNINKVNVQRNMIINEAFEKNNSQFPTQVTKEQWKEFEDFVIRFLQSEESDELKKSECNKLKETIEINGTESNEYLKFWGKVRTFLSDSANTATIITAMSTFAAKNGEHIVQWIKNLFVK